MQSRHKRAASSHITCFQGDTKERCTMRAGICVSLSNCECWSYWSHSKSQLDSSYRQHMFPSKYYNTHNPQLKVLWRGSQCRHSRRIHPKLAQIEKVRWFNQQISRGHDSRVVAKVHLGNCSFNSNQTGASKLGGWKRKEGVCVSPGSVCIDIFVIM